MLMRLSPHMGGRQMLMLLQNKQVKGKKRKEKKRKEKKKKEKKKKRKKKEKKKKEKREKIDKASHLQHLPGLKKFS